MGYTFLNPIERELLRKHKVCAVCKRLVIKLVFCPTLNNQFVCLECFDRVPIEKETK